MRPFGSIHPERQVSRLRASLPAVLLAIALGSMASGCASQKWAELRRTPSNPFAGVLSQISSEKYEPSERTMLLLRRYDLADLYYKDPCELCVKLREQFNSEPTPDTLYALAELAYLSAKRLEASNSKKTLELYTAAVMHSYLYLFDPRFEQYQNSYDPHFRGACEVYNAALESMLRIAQAQDHLAPGKTYSIEAAHQMMNVTVDCRGGDWKTEDFAGFKFVSDYEVTGLRNHYHSYGLGVPLIAMRNVDRDNNPNDRYYPGDLSFPVTAFLRIEPSTSANRDHYSAVLELHDPMNKSAINVANRPVPLESDLTTSLAYLLSQPKLEALDTSTAGILHPDEVKSRQGIYMLEPYRPDRIPVLMVHGLWSSPITWMEMFNDLRGSPELRDRFQFWFYLYPTAQPFWYSAAQLRSDLAELRDNLDPHHQHQTLDNMVLVGHSMGGLLAKMQTLESRQDFWKTVSDQPIQMVKATSEIRDELTSTFFFHPNPAIKRVITIATPHRGSRVSNDATRYITGKLINMPRMLVSAQMQLKRDNPGLFLARNPLDVSTSIESLSVGSTVLPVLLSADRPPSVHYHNIVGKISRSGISGTIASTINKGDSDGVVSVASAHLDDVESEIEVNADHSKVHAHPLSVLEVRRVLLDHLSELPGTPPTPLERLPWTATGPSMRTPPN